MKMPESKLGKAAVGSAALGLGIMLLKGCAEGSSDAVKLAADLPPLSVSDSASATAAGLHLHDQYSPDTAECKIEVGSIAGDPTHYETRIVTNEPIPDGVVFKGDANYEGRPDDHFTGAFEHGTDDMKIAQYNDHPLQDVTGALELPIGTHGHTIPLECDSFSIHPDH